MFYICEEKGKLIFREVDGFVPKTAVLEVNDDSLRNKEIKIIEEEVTDELTGETRLVKKAVVDDEKQALKEQKEQQRQDALEAKRLEKENRIKDIKEKVKNDKMTLKEMQDLLVKIVEHLGI